MNRFDLQARPVIAGSGLAGLAVALRMAPRPCIVLSAAPLATETSSGWAQGGIAAAVGADDAPALQIADTLAAGDGLCDPDAVRRIIEAGPDAIGELAALGARFDRAADGELALGLEAAHSRRRIVHAAGDGTGREVIRALVQAVRATPSITVLEGASLAHVLVGDGAVQGVEIRQAGRLRRLRTTQLVIATGGIGGLFLDTTNPLGSTGSGIAIAARAGAALGDLEFIQFHPTALALPEAPGGAAGTAPMPLISEAVRGEGAVLIDETGARFMDNELAPRDVVSRAVWRHLALGHRVHLDAREALGARFAARFPSITASCLARGIDPATMPIPIRPAAHYHMGGIAVDADGRSTLPGLWACGEAACTGLHGANRLASNSLLEAAVCGGRIGALLAGMPAAMPRSTPAAAMLPAADGALAAVRRILSRDAGVLRDAAGLRRAVDALLPLARRSDAALLGLMIAQAAHDRRESRGGHFRTDYPAALPRAVRRLCHAHEILEPAGLAAAAQPQRMAS